MTEEYPNARTEVDDALARRLELETPRPSPALRRRVGQRVGAALRRRALRIRALLLIVGGLCLLALAAVLAVSVPN
jgi:hypothetical protein